MVDSSTALIPRPPMHVAPTSGTMTTNATTVGTDTPALGPYSPFSWACRGEGPGHQWQFAVAQDTDLNLPELNKLLDAQQSRRYRRTDFDDVLSRMYPGTVPGLRWALDSMADFDDTGLARNPLKTVFRPGHSSGVHQPFDLLGDIPRVTMSFGPTLGETCATLFGRPGLFDSPLFPFLDLQDFGNPFRHSPVTGDMGWGGRKPFSPSLATTFGVPTFFQRGRPPTAAETQEDIASLLKWYDSLYDEGPSNGHQNLPSSEDPRLHHSRSFAPTWWTGPPPFKSTGIPYEMTTNIDTSPSMYSPFTSPLPATTALPAAPRKALLPAPDKDSPQDIMSAALTTVPIDTTDRISTDRISTANGRSTQTSVFPGLLEGGKVPKLLPATADPSITEVSQAGVRSDTEIPKTQTTLDTEIPRAALGATQDSNSGTNPSDTRLRDALRAEMLERRARAFPPATITEIADDTPADSIKKPDSVSTALVVREPSSVDSASQDKTESGNKQGPDASTPRSNRTGDTSSMRFPTLSRSRSEHATSSAVTEATSDEKRRQIWAEKLAQFRKQNLEDKDTAPLSTIDLPEDGKTVKPSTGPYLSIIPQSSPLVTVQSA